MGMLKEFRDFAVKGNAIDMAVGIVIGAAFTGIVNSLVKDIIMPPLGWVVGNLDFSAYQLSLSKSVAIRYGAFLNSMVNFLIVAFAIFLVIKQVNRFTRKREEPAAPSTKECPYCAFYHLAEGRPLPAVYVGARVGPACRTGLGRTLSPQFSPAARSMGKPGLTRVIHGHIVTRSVSEDGEGTYPRLRFGFRLALLAVYIAGRE